jgi:hypothetical protein
MSAAQWKASSVVIQASKKLVTTVQRPRLGRWALATWYTDNHPPMRMSHCMVAIFAV